MKKTTILIAALITSNLVLAGFLIADKATSTTPQKEIFADSIEQMRFDGHVVHIDLARSRVNLTDGRRPSPAEREVIARVALTSDAAMLLYAGMTKAFAARPPIQAPAQPL